MDDETKAEVLKDNYWGYHPAVVMPRTLANHLHGTTDLRFERDPERARELRLIALANLRALFDAVMITGWNTHTNDWDWGVYIEFVDGTTVENINVAWEFVDLGGVVKKLDDLGACVHPKEIPYISFECVPIVDGEPDYSGNDETIRRFIIDDIVSVHFEEMH